MLITNFESKDTLLEYAKNKIIEIIIANQSKYKSSSFFMSGGSSVALYQKIADEKSIQPKFLHLFQVDERYIVKSDKDSNQKQLLEIFKDYPLENKHFINTEYILENCVSDYNSQLSEINQPDITILGFGLDGHFASIFPDSNVAANLESKEKVLNTQSMSGYPVLERISLSPNYISKSKKIFVMLIGKDKKTILEEFLGGKIPVNKFPAKYWLDRENVEILTCFE
jgi:6-phosphogluconolactonase